MEAIVQADRYESVASSWNIEPLMIEETSCGRCLGRINSTLETPSMGVQAEECVLSLVQQSSFEARMLHVLTKDRVQIGVVGHLASPIASLTFSNLSMRQVRWWCDGVAVTRDWNSTSSRQHSRVPTRSTAFFLSNHISSTTASRLRYSTRLQWCHSRATDGRAIHKWCQTLEYASSWIITRSIASGPQFVSSAHRREQSSALGNRYSS